jgi:hypothetical protein
MEYHTARSCKKGSVLHKRDATPIKLPPLLNISYSYFHGDIHHVIQWWYIKNFEIAEYIIIVVIIIIIISGETALFQSYSLP